jgi:hypothetical protein
MTAGHQKPKPVAKNASLGLSGTNDAPQAPIVPRPPSAAAQDSAEAAVLTKAVMRAADLLGLSRTELKDVLGVSPATVSRMGAGAYRLAPGEKAFELAALFVRLYRALDAVTGGDGEVNIRWLRNENAALGGVPGDLIKSIAGLMQVLAYLDARRAVV